MAVVFISYRRGDEPAVAARLADTLGGLLGRDNVFRDIDRLEPGTPFPTALESAVVGSDALLVVIGPQWVDDASEEGVDWVYREIDLAMRANKKVVPVLVAGADLPAPEQVPAEVRSFLQGQAIRLDDEGWDDDVARMVRRLGFRTAQDRRRRKAAVSILGILLLVVGIAIVLSAIGPWPPGTTSAQPAPPTTESEDQNPSPTLEVADACTGSTASLPGDAANLDSIKGDFDGDGRDDLVFAYNAPGSPEVSRFFVQLDTGYTNEFVDVLYTQINPPSFLSTVDINGDGLEEVFVQYAGGASNSTVRALTFSDCRMTTLGEFLVGGSIGHGDGLECPFDDADLVVYSSELNNAADGYLVRWERYAISDGELVLLEEQTGIDAGFEDPLVNASYQFNCAPR